MLIQKNRSHEKSRKLGMGPAFAATAIAATIMTIGLSACQSGIEDPSGTYSGEYSLIQNKTVQSSQVTTTIDPKQWQQNQRQISLTDQTTQKVIGAFTIAVNSDIFNGTTLSLSSPLINGNNPIPLKMVQGNTCAEAAPAQPGQPSYTTLCVQNDVISLFSTDAAGDYRVLLYLSRGASIQPDPIVKNGQFALDDLFRRVMTTNYMTRTATETLYQSLQATQVASNNALVPSLGASGVVGTTQAIALGALSSPLYAISTIGTVVPFIFPSNWFTFDQQNALYEGQVMAYKVLVANQMNLAEDLYHQILNDSQVLAEMNAMESSLEARRAIVAMRTQLGYNDVSDVTVIDDLITQNLNSIAQTQQSVSSEYANLSEGVGLSPQYGIQGLIAEPPIDFTQLQPMDPSGYMAEALSGSLEIRQALYLEQAAAANVQSQSWSFLSPSSWVDLDINVFNQITVAKSSLAQVQVTQQQTQSDIQQQLISLTSLYNELLTQNQNLQQEMVNHQNDLTTVEAAYVNGTTSILVMRQTFEDMLQLQIQQTAAQTAFATVQGKLNRLLWQGPYANVLQMPLPTSASQP